MTINRYRYFYACAFDMYGDHLFAFVDRMAELDHAKSTVKLYLSCINDVAKAMATAGNAACDLDEKRALELVAAMGWIKSRKTYARFMMKRFVGFLAERAAASLASLKFQRTASTLSAGRSALLSGTTLRRSFDMRSNGNRFDYRNIIQLNQSLISSSKTSLKAWCRHCVDKSIAALVAGDEWPGIAVCRFQEGPRGPGSVGGAAEECRSIPATAWARQRYLIAAKL
jgi:hypothetical protein